MAIANALQLETARRRASLSFWTVLASFVLHMYIIYLLLNCTRSTEIRTGYRHTLAKIKNRTKNRHD